MRSPQRMTNSHPHAYANQSSIPQIFSVYTRRWPISSTIANQPQSNRLCRILIHATTCKIYICLAHHPQSTNTVRSMPPCLRTNLQYFPPTFAILPFFPFHFFSKSKIKIHNLVVAASPNETPKSHHHSSTSLLSSGQQTFDSGICSPN